MVFSVVSVSSSVAAVVLKSDDDDDENFGGTYDVLESDSITFNRQMASR